MSKPMRGEHYRHYKGGLYIVDGVATHTETGEEFVVYHSFRDQNELLVRPLNMFMSLVDNKPRFKHVAFRERKYQ